MAHSRQLKPFDFDTQELPGGQRTLRVARPFKDALGRVKEGRGSRRVIGDTRPPPSDHRDSSGKTMAPIRTAGVFGKSSLLRSAIEGNPWTEPLPIRGEALPEFRGLLRLVIEITAERTRPPFERLAYPGRAVFSGRRSKEILDPSPCRLAERLCRNFAASSVESSR